MNKKKLIPLAALGAAIAALAVVLILLNRTQSEEEETGIPLCTLDSASVTAIRYTDAAGDEPAEVALSKTDAGWVLDSDPELPVDQTKAETIASNLTGLTALRELGENADVDAMGFETPSYTFELTAGDETWNLTVGDKNPMTDTWYVQTAGDGPVFTVELADISGISKTPRQLYSAQSITDLAVDDVTVMTVSTGSGELSFEQKDGTWTLADDPDHTLDQSTVKKMANTICNLTTQWTVTSPGADELYGLDAPNAVVTLVGTAGSVQCSFGGLTDADDTVCYLRSSGAPNVVYEVSAENLSAFAYDKTSLAGATPETAASEDVVAEYPVGGADDFADAQ